MRNKQKKLSYKQKINILRGVTLHGEKACHANGTPFSFRNRWDYLRAVQSGARGIKDARTENGKQKRWAEKYVERNRTV